MGIWQTRQDKFEWKLYRNALLTAIFAMVGYCMFGIIMFCILLVFFGPNLAGFIGPLRVGGGIIAMGIFAAVFIMTALSMPGAAFTSFGGALFIFALTCLVSATLRFKFMQKPKTDKKTLILSFLLILLIYGGLEFLTVFFTRSFVLHTGIPLPEAWIVLLFLRLYLLWNSHRAIMEYDNPVVSGRLIS